MILLFHEGVADEESRIGGLGIVLAMTFGSGDVILSVLITGKASWFGTDE